MKFLFIGGGTGGPTTTLLAIAEGIRERNPKAEFLFVTDDSEPSNSLLKKADIQNRSIKTGKLRRYASMRNITDIFATIGAIHKAKKILKDFEPKLVLSAGSFVSVPVVLAARKKYPLFVHQQDLDPGLANRIAALFAKRITVAFEQTKKMFPAKKTIWSGNPVRSEIFSGSAERAREWLHLEKDVPTLLVIGGGTGSVALNSLIEKAGEKIVPWMQIVHITGMGKETDWKHARYHKKEFIFEQMADVYQLADIVISRAGMATTTELAALKKPVIMIPMPNTHQEDNADFFEENEAVIWLDQEEIKVADVAYEVKQLWENKEKAKKMGENLFHLLRPDIAKEKILNEIAAHIPLN